MLSRAKFLRLTGLTAAALAISSEALPKSNDGIVRVKSLYPFQETIERLKKDIAAKGIRFFSEIDQSKLAADAGIKLNPSTLLVFGNPPLGTQFVTANPNAGLDGRSVCWCFRTIQELCRRSTPISAGLQRAMASLIVMNS